MRSKLNRLLCFLALALPVLLLALSLSAQTTNEVGVIQGHVVNSDGISVKGSEVHAQLLGSPMATAIRYVTADEAGEFLIDQLEFGTYQAFGMKEEEGFPDTFWFSRSEAPLVTISASQASGTVLLKFGPKAGVLTGTVKDARTGKPVLAGFTLRRLNDSWLLTTSQPANFRVFVSPLTETGCAPSCRRSSAGARQKSCLRAG
jgi:hypothetical protein